MLFFSLSPIETKKSIELIGIHNTVRANEISNFLGNHSMKAVQLCHAMRE